MGAESLALVRNEMNMPMPSTRMPTSSVMMASWGRPLKMLEYGTMEQFAKDLEVEAAALGNNAGLLGACAYFRQNF